MPDASSSNTTTPGREPETTEGIGYRRGRSHISRAEAKNQACLPWRSNGCEHGDTMHRVQPDGTIVEIGDRKTKPKPDAIKMRQARRFGKGRC
jgi:hypothetical protein